MTVLGYGPTKENMEKPRLDREVIAMRVAKELPDGGYVNLGLGIPTLVSTFVHEGNTVFYHSESGVLNCGPLAEEAENDIDLINAGGQFLELVPGPKNDHRIPSITPTIGFK